MTAIETRQLTLRERAAALLAATEAQMDRDEAERAEEERKGLQEELVALVKKVLNEEIDVAALGEATEVTIDGLSFTTRGRRYRDGFTRPELYLRRRCMKCGTDGWEEVGSLYTLGAALAADHWQHGYEGCPELEDGPASALRREAHTPTIAERLEELIREIVAEGRGEG